MPTKYFEFFKYRYAILKQTNTHDSKTIRARISSEWRALSSAEKKDWTVPLSTAHTTLDTRSRSQPKATYEEAYDFLVKRLGNPPSFLEKLGYRVSATQGDAVEDIQEEDDDDSEYIIQEGAPFFNFLSVPRWPTFQRQYYRTLLRMPKEALRARAMQLDPTLPETANRDFMMRVLFREKVKLWKSQGVASYDDEWDDYYDIMSPEYQIQEGCPPMDYRYGREMWAPCQIHKMEELFRMTKFQLQSLARQRHIEVFQEANMDTLFRLLMMSFTWEMHRQGLSVFLPEEARNKIFCPVTNEMEYEDEWEIRDGFPALGIDLAEWRDWPSDQRNSFEAYLSLQDSSQLRKLLTNRHLPVLSTANRLYFLTMLAAFDAILYSTKYKTKIFPDHLGLDFGNDCYDAVEKYWEDTRLSREHYKRQQEKERQVEKFQLELAKAREDALEKEKQQFFLSFQEKQEKLKQQALEKARKNCHMGSPPMDLMIHMDVHQAWENYCREKKRLQEVEERLARVMEQNVRSVKNHSTPPCKKKKKKTRSERNLSFLMGQYPALCS